MSEISGFHERLFRVGSRGGGRFPAPGDLFECIIEDIYRAVLSAGDLALDGGAHVGRHAFPMAGSVGPGGLVLAAEAHPKFAQDLVRRAKKRGFSEVKVVAAALSDRIGRVPFHCVKVHPAYSGIRSRRYDFDDEVQVIEVAATTIDAILADDPSRRLRFVKLDLEGGEFRALQGGAATLKSHKPLMVFENDQERSAENYGYSKEEWFAFFERLEYETFTLFGVPYGRADWGRRDIPWYFIAAGPGDAEFVRDRVPAILSLYQQVL